MGVQSLRDAGCSEGRQACCAGRRHACCGRPRPTHAERRAALRRPPPVDPAVDGQAGGAGAAGRVDGGIVHIDSQPDAAAQRVARCSIQRLRLPDKELRRSGCRRGEAGVRRSAQLRRRWIDRRRASSAAGRRRARRRRGARPRRPPSPPPPLLATSCQAPFIPCPRPRRPARLRQLVHVGDGAVVVGVVGGAIVQGDHDGAGRVRQAVMWGKGGRAGGGRGATGSRHGTPRTKRRYGRTAGAASQATHQPH